MTRREVLGLLGSMSVATWLPRRSAMQGDAAPALAPGAPQSPERIALIDAFRTVAISISRERIAAARKAGRHPLHTEYAGVDHNVWQWAYTEPALPRWLFSKRRAT